MKIGTKARRFWALSLASLVLIGAVAAQGLDRFRETVTSKGSHLAAYIPATPTGWTSRELPLGPNEFVAGEVEKVLNFDDVLNRQYTRAGQEFGVYVAYWGAGKMPTRLVASHTPDRCWTENGLRCVDMKFQVPVTSPAGELQPTEWRAFETPDGGQTIYVIYWHLVEGELYDYGQRFNSVPSPFLWWKDAVQQALLGSREQYFIRITSSEPLEEGIWRDPGFLEVLSGLGRLGLVKEPEGGAK